MSTIQKIAKNTTLLVITNMVSLAMGFIINLLIAWDFSKGDYGIVNWAMNLATMFTLVTDLGLSMFLAIQLPRYPGQLKAYLDNALSIKLIVSMITFAALVVSAVISHNTPLEFSILLIISIYSLSLAVAQVLQSVFQAFQAMEHMAVCQVLNGVTLAAGTVLVVTYNMGVIAFAAVYAIAGLAILAYTFIILSLFYTKPRPRFDLSLWRQILIGGLPLSVAAVLSFFYFKIDIQLIKMFLGDTGVAEYTTAFKLVEAIIVIPALYCTAIFPLISTYFHEGNPNLDVLFRKSVKYLYMMGAPIAVGTIMLADKFILTIYLGKYASPTIEVLQLLGLGALLIYVNYVPNNFLSATNMQIANVKISAVCIVVNVVLNLLMIPAYGVIGSALAMVLTQALTVVFTYYLIRGAGHRYPGFRDAGKVTACALGMGAVVYLLRDYNQILVVVAGAAVYGALVLVTRVLSAEDFELLSNVFKKKSTVTP